MKINIKIRSFPNPTETFIVHHIVALLQRGIKFKIYANTYRGVETYLNPHLLKEFAIDGLMHKNLKVKKGIGKVFQILKILTDQRIIKYSLKYYSFKPQWSFEPIYNLYNYKNFDDTIVCHIQFNTSIKPLMDLSAIGYINPAKIIITFHGFDAFRLNKEIYNKRYSEFYGKCVYAVTVNSNYVKQHLIKSGLSERKINIIPMGIDVAMYKDKEKESVDDKTLKLVSVGRLIQLKGHKYGMRALQLLLNKGYNVTYTIVGDGLTAYKNELKEAAKELGCEAQINFVGQKSHNEVIAILKESSIFLMTSTFDDLTGREEAFGLAAVEAQACGLPVIAFKSGGVSEIIINEETGYLVGDRDVQEMAEKIELLYKNDSQYKKLSQNARTHALTTFDNNKFIQQYIELYNLKA